MFRYYNVYLKKKLYFPYVFSDFFKYLTNDTINSSFVDCRTLRLTIITLSYELMTRVSKPSVPFPRQEVPRKALKRPGFAWECGINTSCGKWPEIGTRGDLGFLVLIANGKQL